MIGTEQDTRRITIRIRAKIRRKGKNQSVFPLPFQEEIKLARVEFMHRAARIWRTAWSLAGTCTLSPSMKMPFTALMLHYYQGILRVRNQSCILVQQSQIRSHCDLPLDDCIFTFAFAILGFGVPTRYVISRPSSRTSSIRRSGDAVGYRRRHKSLNHKSGRVR